MVNFNRQQLDARWDMMPVNLREILCSPERGKIVWDIGKNNHLIDEKIGKIMKLTSYVIMGFIHIEDLPKEIKETLNINFEIANLIYREIDKKIFAPIRNEIDKIYSPVGLSAEAPAKEETLMKENAQFVDIEKISLPKLELKKEDFINLTTFEKQKFGEVEKPAEIKKELPTVPLPSETISEAKVVFSSAETLLEDKPIIIHKEIETKPTLGKQRSLGGLFGFLRAQKLGEVRIEEQKPITAEVEMPIVESDAKLQIHANAAKNFELEGKVELSKVIQETPKPPKVVHYSELKTPLNIPMPPKSFEAVQGKPEVKSKVFESEIEKAKAAGLIMNNQQSAISNQQFKIEEIPIEIEEVPRQSFLSRIFQFFANLFITKKKVIKEVAEVKIPEAPMPLKPEKEFSFPLEIKLPTPPVVSKVEPPKKELELPRPSIPKLKTDTFKDKEIKPPEVHQILSRIEEEIKEKSQPIMPQPAPLQPEKPKIQDEEVIDLRTFEKIKK